MILSNGSPVFFGLVMQDVTRVSLGAGEPLESRLSAPAVAIASSRRRDAIDGADALVNRVDSHASYLRLNGPTKGICVSIITPK